MNKYYSWNVAHIASNNNQLEILATCLDESWTNHLFLEFTIILQIIQNIPKH